VSYVSDVGSVSREGVDRSHVPVRSMRVVGFALLASLDIWFAWSLIWCLNVGSASNVDGEASSKLFIFVSKYIINASVNVKNYMTFFVFVLDLIGIRMCEANHQI
jgi:hypothetical protein